MKYQHLKKEKKKEACLVIFGCSMPQKAFLKMVKPLENLQKNTVSLNQPWQIISSVSRRVAPSSQRQQSR